MSVPSPQNSDTDMEIIQSADALQAGETTPVPDAKFNVGDFTLISADGHLFKTNSYLLFGASPVFRAPAELCPTIERSVTFTDWDIESSSVISLFLDVITVGQLPPVAFDLPHIPELLSFCKKYECTVAARCVLFSVRELVVYDQAASLRALDIGAGADDMDTVVSVLKSICERGGKLPNLVSLLGPKRSVWPVEYLWAFARAQDRTTPKPAKDKATGTPLKATTTPVNGIPAAAAATPATATTPVLTPADLWKEFKRLLSLCKTRQLEWDQYPCGPPEPTYDPRWDGDGDLELESADNVLFRIESYHIMSASSVLRRMITNGEKRIHFTSTDFSSPVIHMFLALVTTGRLEVVPPQFLGLADLPHVGKLVVFLRTYECTALLNVVVSYVLRQAQLDQAVAFHAFMICAIADDHRAAGRAIGGRRGPYRTRQWAFKNEPGDEADCPENGADILKPTKWSFKYWRDIPLKYIWALELSWKPHADGVQASWGQKIEYLLTVPRTDANDVVFTTGEAEFSDASDDEYDPSNSSENDSLSEEDSDSEITSNHDGDADGRPSQPSAPVEDVQMG